MHTADGVEQLVVAIDRGRVTVDGRGLSLVGEPTSTGRRYGQGGRPVADVLSDGEMLKLTTPEGRLLWRVRLGGGKIKIADNDELASPYTLKDKGAGSWNVKHDSADLGKVVFVEPESSARVRDAQGRDRFVIRSTRRSASWGLLLLGDVPELQRYVLMAELVARGR